MVFLEMNPLPLYLQKTLLCVYTTKHLTHYNPLSQSKFIQWYIHRKYLCFNMYTEGGLA